MNDFHGLSLKLTNYNKPYKIQNIKIQNNNRMQRWIKINFRCDFFLLLFWSFNLIRFVFEFDSIQFNCISLNKVRGRFLFLIF